MSKLLYTGLKVRIQNIKQHILTSLQDSYFRNGFLYIKRIDIENNCVYVSYAPAGSIEEKVGVEYIEPIYDRNLGDVLKEKLGKYNELEYEIRDIKEYI